MIRYNSEMFAKIVPPQLGKLSEKYLFKGSVWNILCFKYDNWNQNRIKPSKSFLLQKEKFFLRLKVPFI